MKILLVITFVYGALRLLTHTKIFDTHLTGITESIIPSWNGRRMRLFIVLDIWFFYFSLAFQAWYWIFRDSL